MTLYLLGFADAFEALDYVVDAYADFDDGVFDAGDFEFAVGETAFAAGDFEFAVGETAFAAVGYYVAGIDEPLQQMLAKTSLKQDVTLLLTFLMHTLTLALTKILT